MTKVKKAVAKPATKIKKVVAKAKTKAKAVKAVSKTASKSAAKKSFHGKPMKWDAFITPLDDRLIVLIEQAVTQTAGGLYIPATVSTDRPNRGQVLAVGRGHRDAKGRIKPMDVKVGDEVLFAAFTGNEMKMQDQNVIILREADLLGIVE
ncbi:MAG: hypothetical protein AB7N80_00255 [Bdellovibrionales bacterium]